MEMTNQNGVFADTRPKPAYGRQGLDWIIRPEYSFRVFSMWKMKNQPWTMKTMKNHEKPWKTMKNRPGTLTRGHNWLGEGGQGRNNQNRHLHGVTTDQGRGGQSRNNQKRHLRGVTTDLLDV